MGKVRKIDGLKSIDEVFTELEGIFKEFLWKSKELI
jgi:hypothetical protein